jgi:protein gp37
MSQSTPIQWTDDTVNPVMGCNAPCELRPGPGEVRELIRTFLHEEFPNASLIDKSLDRETNDCNATEMYQLREVIVRKAILAAERQEALKGAVGAIAKRLKERLDSIFICYAHQQHMFRGGDVTNPDKRNSPGFAPQFEAVTKFPGRMAKAACSTDLFGKLRPDKPWLNLLPRTFFVSDMADALSAGIDFEYLEREIIDVGASNRGRQHLWLWLTKKPKEMAKFALYLAKKHKSWPENLVAMTSVTSQDTVWRAEALKSVPARFRGLSVEPLWGEVKLPLEGICWCIVGGQSGPGAKTFDLAWARSVQRQCKKAGTGFFVKQLGAKPVVDGTPMKLKNPHGGDWNEWPGDLRVREMPSGFRSLRVEAMG